MSNVAKLPVAEGPTFYDYVAHELANLLPMIDQSNYENLKADIAKQGILEPIVLFEGKILDGRNRYKAAKELSFNFAGANFKTSKERRSKLKPTSSLPTSFVVR